MPIQFPEPPQTFEMFDRLLDIYGVESNGFAQPDESPGLWALAPAFAVRKGTYAPRLPKPSGLVKVNPSMCARGLGFALILIPLQFGSDYLVGKIELWLEQVDATTALAECLQAAGSALRGIRIGLIWFPTGGPTPEPEPEPEPKWPRPKPTVLRKRKDSSPRRKIWAYSRAN